MGELLEFTIPYTDKIENISYKLQGKKADNRPTFNTTLKTSEPQYTYKYDREYKVNCSYCGYQMPWTELECEYHDYCDELGYDFGFQSTETKCPKCQEWDCCILKFQKD